MHEDIKSKQFPPIPPDVENIGKIVLDAAFKVHTNLGPGLLESVYEACLAYEIRQRGVLVDTQIHLPVLYENVKVEAGLRMDMLVGNCAIVEIKSVEKANPLYEAQLLTYLKLSGIRLGYLINFNTVRLKDGIRRLVR